MYVRMFQFAARYDSIMWHLPSILALMNGPAVLQSMVSLPKRLSLVFLVENHQYVGKDTWLFITQKHRFK
jgi:hypothetical protein